MLRRGSLSLIKAPLSLETGKGTVTNFVKVNCANYSSERHPSHSNNRKSDGPSTHGYRPVNLAYRALEYRGAEKDHPTKSSLIIHHSLLGRKENWNPISEIINRTTQRKIINVDARNHGESPQTDEMTLPLMAKDLINLIGAMPTTDKISYLGHSMGGRVGILLALMQPKLLDKLILVDSSNLFNQNSRRHYSALREACFSLVEIEDRLRTVNGSERLNLASKTIENIVENKHHRANLLSNLILSDKSNGESMWRHNISAVMNFLSHPDLDFPTINKINKNNATFEGPTLFINGDRSKFVSREDEKVIRRDFPNAEFIWLKDCGHLLHIDKQREFCEEVITFLEK